MKEKNIKSYTKDIIPEGKTDWERLLKMSEKDINAAALADKENPPWTKEMLAHAKLTMPQKKVVIHMSVDKDVVDWFKADGRGYQTRMNAVLKSYVHQHLQKEP